MTHVSNEDAPATKPVDAISKPKSFKDSIEEHPVVYFLGVLVTGFVAGVAAYKGIATMAGQELFSKHVVTDLKQKAEEKSAEVDRLKNAIAEKSAPPVAQKWLTIKAPSDLRGIRHRVIAEVNGIAYSFPSDQAWFSFGSITPSAEYKLPIYVDGEVASVVISIIASIDGRTTTKSSSRSPVMVRTFPFEYLESIDVAIGGPVPTRGRDVPNQSVIRGVNSAPSQESVKAVVAFTLK